MNSEVVKISQIKLNYDETKKSIIANVVTVFENGLKQKKQISKMDLISDMLNSFSKQEGLTVSELIAKGLVIVSESLKDKDVLIRDGEHYNKIIYDYEKNMFVENRLSRSDRRELGLYSDIEGEVKEETISETDELTDLIDFNEIVTKIKELNPDVEIELGDKDTDLLYYKRIFASVPASELKLPKGFYYNDKNGITNKHHTTSGSYVTIDVEPLSKVIDTKEEHDTLSSEEIVEESDGALDVSTGDSVMEDSRVVTETESDKKPKKGIKFLKVIGTAGAIIAAGYIIVKSGIFGFTDSFENKDNRSDDNNNNRYEDNIEDNNIETTFTTPEPEVISNGYDEEKNDVYEANIQDDIEVQIQRVNDACFTYDPCSLYTLVSFSDRQPIEVITTARNETLANRYDVIDLIDQYIKYVFEGATMFDGNVVKAYDYLSPYARYIVLVSGQSMLELCTDYNYSTIYNGGVNVYDYESVTDSFNILIDQTYRELTNKEKTY